MLADRVEPDGGVLDEGDGRDEDRVEPGRDGHQHATDQPHVVVQRQPGDCDVLRRIDPQPDATDGVRVRLQIAVGDDHAFGRGGAA